MLFYAGSFLSKILSACALIDLRAKSLSTAKKKDVGGDSKQSISKHGLQTEEGGRDVTS